MRKIFLITLALLAFSSAVFAVPNIFNIQGANLKNNSIIIEKAVIPFEINFYNSPSSAISLYNRTYNVSVTNGTYSFLVENVNEDIFKNNTRTFIGIKIDNGTETSPRINVTSVPYAYSSNISGSVTEGAIVNKSISQFEDFTFKNLISNMLTLSGDLISFGSLNATFINATEIRQSGNLVQTQESAMKLGNISNYTQYIRSSDFNMNNISNESTSNVTMVSQLGNDLGFVNHANLTDGNIDLNVDVVNSSTLNVGNVNASGDINSTSRFCIGSNCATQLNNITNSSQINPDSINDYDVYICDGNTPSYRNRCTAQCTNGNCETVIQPFIFSGSKIFFNNGTFTCSKNLNITSVNNFKASGAGKTTTILHGCGWEKSTSSPTRDLEFSYMTVDMDGNNSPAFDFQDQSTDVNLHHVKVRNTSAVIAIQWGSNSNFRFTDSECKDSGMDSPSDCIAGSQNMNNKTSYIERNVFIRQESQAWEIVTLPNTGNVQLRGNTYIDYKGGNKCLSIETGYSPNFNGDIMVEDETIYSVNNRCHISIGATDGSQISSARVTNNFVQGGIYLYNISHVEYSGNTCDGSYDACIFIHEGGVYKIHDSFLGNSYLGQTGSSDYRTQISIEGYPSEVDINNVHFNSTNSPGALRVINTDNNQDWEIRLTNSRLKGNWTDRTIRIDGSKLFWGENNEIDAPSSNISISSGCMYFDQFNYTSLPSCNNMNIFNGKIINYHTDGEDQICTWKGSWMCVPIGASAFQSESTAWKKGNTTDYIGGDNASILFTINISKDLSKFFSNFNLGNISNESTGNITLISQLDNNLGFTDTIFTLGNVSNYTQYVKSSDFNRGNISNESTGNVTLLSQLFNNAGFLQNDSVLNYSILLPRYSGISSEKVVVYLPGEDMIDYAKGFELQAPNDIQNFTKGKFGSAFNFSNRSNSNGIQIRTGQDLRLNNSYSLSFWFKLYALHGDGSLTEKFFGGETSAYAFALRTSISSSTRQVVTYSVFDGAACNPTAAATFYDTAVDDGWEEKYQMVTVTLDKPAGVMKIYRNGILITTTTNSCISTQTIDNGRNITIGDRDTLTSEQKINGSEDEYIIWNNTVLNDDEIRALYEKNTEFNNKNGYLLKSGGNVKDLTISNNLGIGTTNPTEKLTIIGNVNISGTTITSGLNTTQFCFLSGLCYSNFDTFTTFNLGNVSNYTQYVRSSDFNRGNISNESTGNVTAISQLFNNVKLTSNHTDVNFSNANLTTLQGRDINLYNYSIDLSGYGSSEAILFTLGNVSNYTQYIRSSDFNLNNISNNTLVKGDNATLALWKKNSIFTQLYDLSSILKIGNISGNFTVISNIYISNGTVFDNGTINRSIDLSNYATTAGDVIFTLGNVSNYTQYIRSSDFNLANISNKSYMFGNNVTFTHGNSTSWNLTSLNTKQINLTPDDNGVQNLTIRIGNMTIYQNGSGLCFNNC